MVRDRESVRFIADTLQKKERIGISFEDDRIALPRQKHSLLRSFNFAASWRGLHAHLGEPDRFDAFDTNFRHRRQRHRKLPPATVDDNQVRQIRFLLTPHEASLEHLQHHAEIVAAGRSVDGANTKMPVEVFVRLTVNKSNHRTDGMGTMNHRDIKTFDPLRITFKAQLSLQLFKHFLTGLFLIVAFSETLFGIVFGHLHEMPPVATLRTQNLDFFAFAFAEILFANLEILQRHRQENLVGDESLALIELG